MNHLHYAASLREHRVVRQVGIAVIIIGALAISPFVRDGGCSSRAAVPTREPRGERVVMGAWSGARSKRS